MNSRDKVLFSWNLVSQSGGTTIKKKKKKKNERNKNNNTWWKRTRRELTQDDAVTVPREFLDGVVREGISER